MFGVFLLMMLISPTNPVEHTNASAIGFLMIHDSSVAIAINGTLAIVAQLERFTGVTQDATCTARFLYCFACMS